MNLDYELGRLNIINQSNYHNYPVTIRPVAKTLSLYWLMFEPQRELRAE